VSADLLFHPSDPAARLRGLSGVLAAKDAPARLERALLDLLDLDDPALLEAVARGLAGQASDPAARRVLEAVSRSGAPGGARAAALRALRGEPLSAAAAAAAPAAAPPEPAPAAPAPTGPLAPLARAAANPSPEALDDAELALIEVDPDAVDASACAALAEQLEAQAQGADEATRPRLERLARELRELS